jgi:hypothetical protein
MAAKRLHIEEQLSEVTKINQLPDKCYRDILKLYTRSIKYALEQANKQIKATMRTMNLPDYKGLVFLASDGNYFIDPPNVARIVGLILNNPNVYKSINMVVYLTVNVVTTRPDDETLSRLWVRLYRDNEYFETIPLPFLQDLFDKWVEHYKKVSGVELDTINEINAEGLTETDVLGRTRFVKPIRVEEAERK